MAGGERECGEGASGRNRNRAWDGDDVFVAEHGNNAPTRRCRHVAGNGGERRTASDNRTGIKREVIDPERWWSVNASTVRSAALSFKTAIGAGSIEVHDTTEAIRHSRSADWSSGATIFEATCCY